LPWGRRGDVDDALDSANGADDRTFVHGDGQVKGFVFPDRDSPTGDLVFATDTRVWVVSDDAGALTPRWAGGITLSGAAAPSAALLLRGLSSPTSQHVFVGASDGRLYQIEVSGGTPVVRFVVLGDGSSAVGAPSSTATTTSSTWGRPRASSAPSARRVARGRIRYRLLETAGAAGEADVTRGAFATSGGHSAGFSCFAQLVNR
jgi:hypothetical protein